ncbi:YheT family hydrolase [Teredinibacter haidensis]|uniref:YheT family hydrolase n=1 Tax=Teredinibacter haidensis TaxID=2731755 RepID=UPI000948F04D|nr:alpha/beta fold hydrolase [Teredinibacter haidensis]
MHNLDVLTPNNDSLAEDFQPPWHLNNHHIQATLSSSKLRKNALLRQHAAMLNNAQTQIIDAGNGVRLLGELNQSDPEKKAKQLIILLHGWEGSSQSNYIISATATLLAAGYDVVRLNFRDHGDSHHLNRGIFNSSLVEEVAGAIKNLQATQGYERSGLMGFSLGGNFALRVGLLNQSLHKPLDAVLAVCPVLDPVHTMQRLENGPFWYEQYFVHKWKRSLLKKLAHFPDYGFHEPLQKLKRLREMNDYFIPRYTNYNTVEDYFRAYTITGHKLAFTSSATSLIVSKDDPVIPVQDLTKIARPTSLSISLQKHGSHCAFLRGIGKPSWVDKYAIAFFEPLLT